MTSPPHPVSIAPEYPEFGTELFRNSLPTDKATIEEPHHKKCSCAHCITQMFVPDRYRDPNSPNIVRSCIPRVWSLSSINFDDY